MDAHEYICFFSKFEYFMYFLVSQFCGPVFSGSSQVQVFGVDRFDGQYGSNNYD
jgi:hypothetical protein